MAELERLREALLELREDLETAKAVSEQTEALLELSEALAGATDRQQALKLLVHKTSALMDSASIAVLEQVDGQLTLCSITSDPSKWAPLPLDPTRKPRNFLDLQSLAPWGEFAEATGWRSLLSVPLSIDSEQRAAIICGHPDRARFTRIDTKFVRRISRFASQTLTKLALTSQTQLLGAVIDGSSSGFAIADARKAEKPLIFVNKAFEKLTGYTSQEVLGQNCRLLSAEPPDSDERLRLRAAVAVNKPGHFLLRNKRKSGEEFWNELILFPVHNDDGLTEYLVATQTDATERVRAREQRERVKEQEAIAQLAAGIAHDFNNLLSAINGSALLITTDPLVTPEIETHATRISQAGARAAKLVSGMLDLGSKRGDYHDFDLNDPVREAIDLARSSIGTHLELSIDLEPKAQRIHGSTTEITQIVVNLLLNARDAFGGDSGKILIALHQAGSLPSVTDVGAFRTGVEYVQLSVRDSGSGMNEATLGQVFEPYFTTKGKDGKGIGLSMVANLIKKMRAAIKVTSVVGEGTTFTLWFPLISDPVDEPVADLAVLKGKTVLIVDDEEQPARVLASYLGRIGAEPSVLTSPYLALEVLSEDHADWDVLITDYDMPEMSGGDLVGAVRKFAPELPILVVTALARQLYDPRLMEGAVQDILEKPLDLPVFGATLARHLTPKVEDTS